MNILENTKCALHLYIYLYIYLYLFVRILFAIIKLYYCKYILIVYFLLFSWKCIEKVHLYKIRKYIKKKKIIFTLSDVWALLYYITLLFRYWPYPLKKHIDWPLTVAFMASQCISFHFVLLLYCCCPLVVIATSLYEWLSLQRQPPSYLNQRQSYRDYRPCVTL